MVMFNKLVRIGPVLIHQRKTLASYINLPFSMIKHNPRLSGVLVSGSDGEKPLKITLILDFRPLFVCCVIFTWKTT
jgi:hypothetical protein